MRVTKNIRAYIEKEVKARIEPKYAAEKAEAERQDKLYSQFQINALAAAEVAFWDYLHEHFDTIADFCALKDNTDIELYPFNWPFYIEKRCSIDGVHKYSTRMNKEIRDTIEEIVVELELGNDKTRLMELLNQI